MLKYLACSFLLLLSTSPVFSGDAPEKLLRQTLKPVVKLVDNEGGHGTAFVVRSELVGEKYRNVAITCQHITAESSEFSVYVMSYDKNGKLMGFTRYPATVYAHSQEKDLAVVLFESKDRLEVAKLALFSYQLKFGEPVKRVGFAMADDPCFDDGKITGVYTRTPAMNKGLIRTSCCILPGDSGGPLFNKHNEVIGVAVRYRVPPAPFAPPIFSRSYYVPMSWFKTWDDGLNNALGFVYNRKEKMPVMAFATLRLKYYEPVGEQNAVFCPTHRLSTAE
jgi:S1-C subfamily serine protease